MKKIKKILSIVFVFAMVFMINTTVFAAESLQTDRAQQYKVSIGNNEISFEEGEIVNIPMTYINNKDFGKSTYASSQTIVGNAGTLKVWGSGHYLYWNIVMSVPVTHFVGTVSSTDMTFGLSAGTSVVTGFSNKCYCARTSKHLYVAHLDGIAYLGTIPVAKTGSNTITWRP